VPAGRRKERHERNHHSDLKALGDRLVGTWKVSGEAEGETSWEWADSGFLLIQRGWTRREGVGQTYLRLQIIGHDRIPGSEPAIAITGRLYTGQGDTLAYVCELEGDTITIWMGEKGSPTLYTGTFSADGNSIEGSWEWPGGDYKETNREEPDRRCSGQGSSLALTLVAHVLGYLSPERRRTRPAARFAGRSTGAAWPAPSGKAAQPARHCRQCTSSTGLRSISLVTQSTNRWPLTCSV
jgi:hypothetical protein